MPVGWIVLVPPPPGDGGAALDAALATRLRGALARQGGREAPQLLRPLPPAAAAGSGRWLTHVSAALHRVLHGTGAGTATAGPLLLVGAGGAGPLLPGLGFALHAARRSVAGYVLVESPLPAAAAADRPGGDWPDAPVTYVLAPDAAEEWRSAALQARLRGWMVDTNDDVAAAVATAALHA